MLPLRMCDFFPQETLSPDKHIYDSASLLALATDTLGISKVWFILFFITLSFRKTHCQSHPGKGKFSFTEHERVGAGRPLEGA